MKDTMNDMIHSLNENVLNYDTRIHFAKTVSNEQAIEFTNKYNGDYVAEMSVQLDVEPIALEIYHLKHDFVRFIDKNNNNVSLTNDGAYISLRVAKRGYAVGDMLKFSPYGSEKSYIVKVAGILRSLVTENITMTTDYAKCLAIPYTISSAFVNISSKKLNLQTS